MGLDDPGDQAGLPDSSATSHLHPEGEPMEVVGYSTCAGCPGGNVEYVPEEMIRNGAEAIHLTTCMVVGYPPCPRPGAALSPRRGA